MSAKQVKKVKKAAKPKPKKTSAKKVASKKSSAKKASPKKSSTKKGTKTGSTNKTAAKKIATKKTTGKKASPKKSKTKKTSTKKQAANKPKKTAVKKTSKKVTSVKEKANSKVKKKAMKATATKPKPKKKAASKPASKTISNSKVKTRYNQKELAFFSKIIDDKLVEAKEQLAFYLAHIKKMGSDPDTKIKGLEDGTTTSENEQMFALAGRQRKHIQHLENAKLRIKNKVYGVCRVTGKLISKARLEAVPHATLSIDAKLKSR